MKTGGTEAQIQQAEYLVVDVLNLLKAFHTGSSHFRRVLDSNESLSHLRLADRVEQNHFPAGQKVQEQLTRRSVVTNASSLHFLILLPVRASSPSACSSEDIRAFTMA